MRTDEELRERFERAVERLDARPGDVARVAARARQRTRRQRVAGAVAGVTVVVAAAVLVPRVVAPGDRFTVDPVATPPAPATATPTTAEQEAAEAPLQDHLRYGVDGVVRHRGGESTILWSQSTQRAFGLADGGAVVQLGAGGPIDRLTPDGELVAAVPASRGGGPRLLTVHDDRIWFSVRESTVAGEDEERLRSVPVDGGEAIDHGVSAGVESFTDALVFLPGGGAAWLGCHLQCSVIVGDGPPTDPGVRTRITDRAGWYAGLTVAAAGDRLALVDGPDPVLGGTSDVVVLDLEGRELVRVRLPVGLALDRAHVEFAAGGEDLVAGDDAHAFVVRGWASDAPTVIGLEGEAGVALLPARPGLPDAEEAG